VISYPAVLDRSSNVAAGWNSSGGNSFRRSTKSPTPYGSQRNEFIARSCPGTANVYPTSPCSPGGSPVPSEARLADVVEGNTVLIGRPEVLAASTRNGASSG
jgi:hypothetical protein